MFEMNEEQFNIVITRKKIKNIILRVKKNGEIYISAPIRTSNTQIMDFVNSKKDWIEKVLKKCKNIEMEEEFKDGNFIKILGEKYKIIIKRSIRNFVSIQENNLLIETTYPSKSEKIFDEYLKNSAMQYFTEKIEKMWQIVGVKADIDVKKMHRTWGICAYKKNHITFNLNLYKQNPLFIEYVILHELVHFIYPNHSKNFYNYVAKYMPDWKYRRDYLSK
jgi:predicted metal-dependent hydrolase